MNYGKIAVDSPDRFTPGQLQMWALFVAVLACLVVLFSDRISERHGMRIKKIGSVVIVATGLIVCRVFG